MLNKRENETKFEYIKRITDNKKELDLDYSEWAKLVCDYDCSSDNGRKGYYIVKRILDEIEKDKESAIVENSNDSEKLLLDLEMKKLEIQKERVKLQDQRRNYLSLVRTEARWEVLLDLIKESIANLDPIEFKDDKAINDYNGEASLLLSDWHIGSLIDTPHNKFNTNIAKDRALKLKKDTIKYCLSNKIKRLNICIMGDMISGLIHVTTRLNNQENVINQVMLCSEMLSQFISDLSNEIPEIVVHYTIGNHGRVSSNIKESLDSENFEYIILEFLKIRLSENKKVNFNCCKHIDKEIVLYNVFGKTIACVHGHREKKIFNSVETLSGFLGVKVDMVVCGHFHNFAVKNNVIVNSSFSGTDEYANNLRFNNNASQVLIVHLDDGSQILHNIVLD